MSLRKAEITFDSGFLEFIDERDESGNGDLTAVFFPVTRTLEDLAIVQEWKRGQSRTKELEVVPEDVWRVATTMFMFYE